MPSVMETTDDETSVRDEMELEPVSGARVSSFPDNRRRSRSRDT